LVAHTWTGRSSGGPVPRGSQAATMLLAHVTTTLAALDDVVVIDINNNGARSTFWTLTQGASATRMRYSVNGKPSSDQTISTLNGQQVTTNVDFAAHAWWTTTYSLVKGNPCVVVKEPTTPAVAVAAPQAQADGSPSCQVFGPTPAQILKSLTAGEFTITGHPMFDGHPTIEITAHYPHTSGTYKLYVDAPSYLPIMSINSINTSPVTTTYNYLPSTPPNLGLLQAPIPPGFRHSDQPILCNPSELGPHETIFGCP
ncbi:MAG: hypothetical protein ACRDRT_16280, partial [Pseudonocardiaceae bacterium]